MSDRVTDQDFSGQELVNEVVSDKVFIGDNFDRVYFGRRKFVRCVFLSCSFRMASFENAAFIRCSFRGNDFTGGFGDDAQFYECYGCQDNFVYFRFGRAHFNFLTTDYSVFRHADMPEKGAFYSGSCRELVAEIIRKMGDAPQIVAIAGLVGTWDSNCWETLTHTVMSVFGLNWVRRVAEHLARYPSLDPILARWRPIIYDIKKG